MHEGGLVGFRGLSLLLQHRALTERLDAIEGAIGACQTADLTDREMALRLLPLLRGFAQALPEHFAAEASSMVALLRESSDDEFARTLEQLDSEHPRLLAVFEGSVTQLAGYLGSAHAAPHASFEHAMTEILTAVAEFRDHEAREDALFLR